MQLHLPLGGDLREGTRSDFRTRGFWAQPKRCLEAMSSSDFTQRRRQERQVQAAAHAEEVQHGTHGKEEREETADQMLDRLLKEMDTPGQEHGGKTGTRSSDSTRRSLMGKGVGESGMALTSAGGSGALVP